ncbi:ComEC/Rec2-related protein [Arthrobacter sp. FB24]|uniref:ComEC/Rec2 family competence protein n=1 Tax=Arthrobacter sp. (strain FB24) TaxID=290399 RepID=UPI0000E5D623|nr:ComEC/Rec2 family competence protein [Arthrobacter sp. FB24]ABK03624.1 ComEC/Rec2-related protein [Arthrobacter sp. FB24]
MGKVSPWHRFIDAAVSGEEGGTPRPPRTAENPPEARQAAEVRAAGIRGIVPRTASGLREVLAARLLPGPEGRVQGTGRPAGTATGNRPQRRTDLRLVPPALLAWAAAVAGVWLPLPALGVLIAGLLLAAVALLAAIRCRRMRRHGAGLVPRSFLTTLGIAVVLSAAIASHSAIAASQKHDGPVADAVTARSAVVVEAEIAGTPRQLKIPGRGGSDRWAVEATAYAIIANGGLIRSDARLLLVGGGDWQHVVPGQRIRTTGKLRPADHGQTQAGTLSATTDPATTAATTAWQEGPGALRRGFAAAAEWIGGDARGLLPGMVTGDTSYLDDQLGSAMKTVGMTHLTAVSGANCSLILGTLLLAARTIRLSRAPAAAAALSGLALFVLMVGPDASVLRAALMGAIGLVSLSGGRTGRGLSFLCLAVIGLLMADPGLGTSFSFLLSVLATLGIVTAGPRIMEWLPPVVPRWLAAGLAVPLSAQLFCSPVIVLLQPQFSSYALLANMVAAPLVAPVTILGTAAVPVVPLAPWAAAVPMAVAGGCAAGVAAVARFFADLPGAALPWPEGPFGAATMVALSGCTLLVLWLVLHPRALWTLVLATHRKTVDLLDLWPRFTGLDERRHRGSLRGINPMSGRNQEWPLRKKHDPSRRRQRPPPGAT